MHIEHDIQICTSDEINNFGNYARVTVHIWTAPPTQNGVEVAIIRGVKLRYNAQKPNEEDRWWAAMPSVPLKNGQYYQIVYLFKNNPQEYAFWLKRLVRDYEQACKDVGIQFGSGDDAGKTRVRHTDERRGVPVRPAVDTPRPAQPVSSPAPAAAPLAPPRPPSGPVAAPRPPVAAPRPPAAPASDMSQQDGGANQPGGTEDWPF